MKSYNGANTTFQIYLGFPSTESAEFEKNILGKGGLETAISCVKNQHSTSVPERHRPQRGSLHET